MSIMDSTPITEYRVRRPGLPTSLIPLLTTTLLLLLTISGRADPATVGGDTSPDGNFSNSYLPPIERMKNTGGSDGSGLCVFTSIEHAAREQGIEVLRGFRRWMERRPGGGYPEKVDKMLKQYCQEMGVPVPQYIQVTTWDPELMGAALRSGRMVSLTYSRSLTGRYGGQRIAHMVNLEHGGAGQFWGILDNNYIEAIEWLTEKELHSVGGDWFIVFLDGGAPPKIKNK
jgi:hypothetical protein